MRRKIRTYFGKKNIVVLTILITCISVLPCKSALAFDTYEDQVLFEELLAQGYPADVAIDEVWERKGQPDVYGTGGIDGVSKYGTASFGGYSKGTSSNSDGTHKHVWDAGTVTKESTCDEQGAILFKCSCGKTKEEKLPLADHEYKLDSYKATCEEYRHDIYTCNKCGDTYTIYYEEEGYGDHIYIPSEDSVDVTCTEDGLIHYVCNVCTDSYDEVVEAKGHTFTKYTVDKEPTCHELGEKSIYCDVCGEKEEGSTVVIPRLEHIEDPNHEIIKATFWKDGSETIRCKECGDVMSETVLPATGGFFRFVIPGAIIVIIALVGCLITNNKHKRM